MKAALLLAAFAALVGCTGLGRQSTGDAQREAIHERLCFCQQRVEVKSFQTRSTDSLALYWCDADAVRECRRAGLEDKCAQWAAAGACH
jgi:hypothetical protein